MFVSYAREDAPSAQRIAEALRSHGVEVWFDQNELRGGDAWDQKIRRQIKECGLFVPVISGRTQERQEGYFRLEWKLAIERTHLMLEGVPFLAPVVVDETAEASAAVPSEFMKVQWTRLPGALPTPQFVAHIKSLLQPAAAPARHSGPGSQRPAPAASAGSRFPIALVASLAAAILGLVAYIALPRLSRPPAAVAEAKSAPAANSAVSPRPTAPVSDKSIAILPLTNMSEDKDTGFFADGVHEDLLTNLALVPELRVVSRTSVMQYRGTTKTIRQIGEELGVTYVLEGSVRRSGNKVRVTGQLINTRTDNHVWARNYDRDLTDIFAIQADLSQEIAAALSAAISPETRRLLERRPTANVAAYDDYLRGRDSRNRSRIGLASPMHEQEKYYRSAVEQDPNFAAAWGELAGLHALFVFWEIDHTPARLAQADAAIAQAVRLAPDSPDVMRSLGTYAYYAYRDYPRATEEYEKVARLQPNDPTVFSSLGLIQRRQGHWAESQVNLRRAVELDPANIGYLRNLLGSCRYLRLWDEARTTQQALIARLPDQIAEQIALADLEFMATGTLQARDELLARLSPEQRNAPLVILARKDWAADRADYAEFTRLDRLQPSLEAEQDPLLSAIFAAVVYHAAGDTAALHRRLAGISDAVRGRLEREPANAKLWSLAAAQAALLGHSEEAVRLGVKSTEMIPESRDALDGPSYRVRLAEIYGVIGDEDRAIAELSRLVKIPTAFGVRSFRVDPAFAAFRGHPRFEALLNDPLNYAPLL